MSTYFLFGILPIVMLMGERQWQNEHRASKQLFVFLHIKLKPDCVIKEVLAMARPVRCLNQLSRLQLVVQSLPTMFNDSSGSPVSGRPQSWPIRSNDLNVLAMDSLVWPAMLVMARLVE